MLKNTFFAKEPRYLKVIYAIAFLGIMYNLCLMIFTTNDINPLVQMISAGTFGILTFRKLFNDQKKK